MPRDLLVLWAHDLDPEHTVLERIRENVGVFAVLNVVKTWIWKPFGRIRSTSPRDYHGYALSLRLVSALYHMFRLDFDLAPFADTRLSRLCPASIVLWPGSICFCFEQQRSSVAVCLRRFAWGLGTGVRLFFFFFFSIACRITFTFRSMCIGFWWQLSIFYSVNMIAQYRLCPF